MQTRAVLNPRQSGILPNFRAPVSDVQILTQSKISGSYCNEESLSYEVGCCKAEKVKKPDDSGALKTFARKLEIHKLRPTPSFGVVDASGRGH